MLETILQAREEHFPVTREKIYLAHAGVSIIPRIAADALNKFALSASTSHQENLATWKEMDDTRATAAKLLRAQPQEIALLGPTALGLNLVAHGLTWSPGDEVIYYPDDYPANVYPWMELEKKAVHPVPLRTEVQGRITWKNLETHITPKTKLVALASANYLTGYRTPLDEIGANLQERGILFCVDGIQTIGAMPTTVEHIDFLSADSHKWMLGPVGAGIFFVKEKNFPLLRPALLGSWNVYSPEFIAQDNISFYPGARRYEPGTLNVPGNLGMKASLELINQIGIEPIAARILSLRKAAIELLSPLGYTSWLDSQIPELEDHEKTGILTLIPPQPPTPEHIAASPTASPTLPTPAPTLPSLGAKTAKAKPSSASPPTFTTPLTTSNPSPASLPIPRNNPDSSRKLNFPFNAR